MFLSDISRIQKEEKIAKDFESKYPNARNIRFIWIKKKILVTALQDDSAIHAFYERK